MPKRCGYQVVGGSLEIYSPVPSGLRISGRLGEESKWACGFDPVDAMEKGFITQREKQNDKDTLGLGKIFTIQERKGPSKLDEPDVSNE